MARESLILICASVILTQFLVVAVSNEQEIDWSTIHDDLRKLAGNLRKKCTGETGTTIEMLEGVEMGVFPDGDKTLACYFKCVMEKGGVMKKDGKINFKILTKMMPQAYKHIGVEMLDQCRDIENSDKCTKAYEFNKCMYFANPVAYFVV